MGEGIRKLVPLFYQFNPVRRKLYVQGMSGKSVYDPGDFRGWRL